MGSSKMSSAPDSPLPGEVSGQLEALGFSAAKGVDRLAEAKVVEADVGESA